MPRMCVAYARIMGTLAQPLSSRARAGIFQLLFGLGDAELHVREPARRSGLHEATVRRVRRSSWWGRKLVLQQWESNGWLEAEPD